MRVWIALIRGINVGGQKKVPMKELRQLMEDLGFERVTTYIHSGNIIFKAKGKATSHEKAISKTIQDNFRFEVDVQVLTPDELETAIQLNPFIETAGYDQKSLYLTRLAQLPEDDRLKTLYSISYPPEEFKLLGQNLYLYLPNGAHNAKLNNNFFESKLKLTATTRNWNTVNALAKMAEDLR